MPVRPRHTEVDEPVDRMSPLDAAFLHIEDDVNHMHIASCAIFEGPAPAYDDLVDLFRGKLPLVPRYRQKVHFVPGAVGRPVWADDPHFRLDYHIRHTALPPPGTRADLHRLMGRLMSQQLDRHRPLWETWVVEGLDDGTWALISKVHHCMVDGISGTDLMAVVLDTTPEGSPPVADDWRPADEPTPTALVVDAVADALVSPAELGRWARRGLRAPKRIAAEMAATVQGMGALGRRLAPNVPLSIEGTIGPHRRWACACTTLADVKRVRAGLGGTVNDVVLAAITKGFRDLLVHRGELVGPDAAGTAIRTLVPVSVRTSGDHTYNNQVSAMIAELPVGIEDPAERLQAIRAQMQDLKDSHQAVAGNVLAELAGFAPPVLLSVGLRTAVTVMRRAPQRSVNTVTTNVPGPQIPLYACGREMLHYYPFVPLSQGVRTGVAILSYNGEVAFGVTGDWDTVPDVHVLAEGISSGMDELLARAAAAAPPASGTKRGRRRS
ncbi:MAG: wax ester/triacylglycerol synthase family O-acyltransferase [Ilumatobacteraceae bacterium]|nr:wax ester/triacylglycerol synthase family O-acyltransferase [Ilumatobacteraceae bacterium]